MPTTACLFFYECEECKTVTASETGRLLRVLFLRISEVAANAAKRLLWISPMCGRFRLSRPKQFLVDHFATESRMKTGFRDTTSPRLKNIPVVRQHPQEPKRIGSSMLWGLIPY